MGLLSAAKPLRSPALQKRHTTAWSLCGSIVQFLRMGSASDLTLKELMVLWKFDLKNGFTLKMDLL